MSSYILSSNWIEGHFIHLFSVTIHFLMIFDIWHEQKNWFTFCTKMDPLQVFSWNWFFHSLALDLLYINSLVYEARRYFCMANQIYHHVRFYYSGRDCHDKRSRWVGIISRLVHCIRERNCRGTRACRSMHTFGFPRQTHNSCYGFHRTPTFQVRSLLLRSACTVLINRLVNLKGKLI